MATERSKSLDESMTDLHDQTKKVDRTDTDVGQDELLRSAGAFNQNQQQQQTLAGGAATAALQTQLMNAAGNVAVGAANALSLMMTGAASHFNDLAGLNIRCSEHSELQFHGKDVIRSGTPAGGQDDTGDGGSA